MVSSRKTFLSIYHIILSGSPASVETQKKPRAAPTPPLLGRTASGANARQSRGHRAAKARRRRGYRTAIAQRCRSGEQWRMRARRTSAIARRCRSGERRRTRMRGVLRHTSVDAPIDRCARAEHFAERRHSSFCRSVPRLSGKTADPARTRSFGYVSVSFGASSSTSSSSVFSKEGAMRSRKYSTSGMRRLRSVRSSSCFATANSRLPAVSSDNDFK